MIADVVFAVAVITVATGAVTEFQFRVGNISSSANGAAVGVGRFYTGVGSFIRAGGVELDGLFTGCAFGRFPEQTSCIDPPGHRDHV